MDADGDVCFQQGNTPSGSHMAHIRGREGLTRFHEGKQWCVVDTRVRGGSRISFRTCISIGRSQNTVKHNGTQKLKTKATEQIVQRHLRVAVGKPNDGTNKKMKDEKKNFNVSNVLVNLVPCRRRFSSSRIWDISPS
jgi:hypothetical protein